MDSQGTQFIELAKALSAFDDGDSGNNGRHVPTTSTEQVGATVMGWLGPPSSAYNDAFPDLANFQQKTIPLLRV